MATHSSFLTGESHGQRSLVGYSPWSCKKLDITEQLSTHTHTHTHFFTCLRQKPELGGGGGPARLTDWRKAAGPV